MAISQAKAHTRRPVIVNGAMSTELPTGLKFKLGASYVFGSTFSIPYNGCLLTFEEGSAYQLDAPLLAYLTANGLAPTAL